MRFGPPVGFALRPDGRRIAYQVLGDAELDLVYVLGFATHLGLLWEDPSVAGFLHKLAAFSRLILLDRLGSGLSDRGPSGQSFEDDMDDVRLVLDTVGSERTAFFGGDLGGRLALLFAATYPERTRAVVAFAAHPATVRDPDYPWGSSEEEREQLLASLRDGSYDPSRMMSRLAPHELANPSFRQWWRMYNLSAITPAEAYDTVLALGSVDIRGLLGSVRVPTLLLHRTEDRWADVHIGRYMAERIPGARLVELPGDDHLPCFGDQDAVVALAQEFLTGALPIADPDRMLATVVFTDLVDSTRLATQLGDRRWHRMLEQHNQVVREQLARFRVGRSRRPGTGSWPASTGRLGPSGPPTPSGPNWPTTACRSGSGCTLARSSWSATTSAASRSTSQPESWPGPRRGRCCARGRSRTWSPGPASGSPTAAPTSSRAFPTPGSCTQSSPPRPTEPRHGIVASKIPGLNQLPPPASHGLDRLPVPGRRMAPQAGRGRRHDLVQYLDRRSG
jgi:pimeloyl-ACP methyl ester carboxylesterase